MQTKKHVVITGAGSGIGRAIARRFNQDGYALTLVGRRKEALLETAGELEGDAFLASADVTDASALGAVIEDAVSAHGKIYGLVANAGIGGPNQVGEHDRFAELISTNLQGAYNSMRVVEAHLDESGASPRRMVAISSILARIGVPGYTGYCASKAGLLGLVRAMALELAPSNVLVNAICPGWVDTDMAWQGLEGLAEVLGTDREGAFAVAMQDVPIGRMGRPEEIAGLVAWLFGPDSEGVTGSAIDANGGAWMS